MSTNAAPEALRERGQAQSEGEANAIPAGESAQGISGAAPAVQSGKELDDENDRVEQGDETQETVVLSDNRHAQAHLSLLGAGTGSLIVSKKLDVDLYTPPIGITAAQGQGAPSERTGLLSRDPSYSATGTTPGLSSAKDSAKAPTAALSFGKRFYQLADRNQGSSSSSAAASSSNTKETARRRQTATGKDKKKASLLSGLTSPTMADDSLTGSPWTLDEQRRPPPSPSARRRGGGGAKGRAGGGNKEGGGGGALLGIGPAGFGVSAPRAARGRFSSLTSSNGSASASQALTPGGGASASHIRGEGGKVRHWTHNLFRPSQQTVEVWLDSWWKRWAILAIAPSMIVSAYTDRFDAKKTFDLICETGLDLVCCSFSEIRSV